MLTSKSFEFINSAIARSVFFIIFTGGLLLFSSIVFANVCNIAFLKTLGLPCLNYLESAGIIAFIYVIGFGIKFGLGKKSLTNSLVTKLQNSANPDKLVDNLKKMSEKEKEILKQQLADCCGIKKNNQQNPNIELSHK